MTSTIEYRREYNKRWNEAHPDYHKDYYYKRDKVKLNKYRNDYLLRKKDKDNNLQNTN